MRKLINISSIPIIILAVMAIFHLYIRKNVPPVRNNVLLEDSFVLYSFENFPIDSVTFIDLDIEPEKIDILSEREQLDQIRDWLLYSVAVESGLNNEELAKALYDVPSIRYGYMNPTANFEYGQTRSLSLSSDKIVAIIPLYNSKNDTIADDELLDYLAHVADKHRKDIGNIPKEIIPFFYEIDLVDQFALITRKAPVKTEMLFDETKGYSEAVVENLLDLETFMNNVDDLTYSKVEDGKLKLGGRKILSYNYRGINIEDIAAIWQSEKKIHDELDAFDDKWQGRIDEFNERWSNKTYKRNDYLLKTQLETQNNLEWQELENEMIEERLALKLVDGSGFSLDPGYDYGSLRNLLYEYKAMLNSLAIGDDAVLTINDISNAEQGLKESDEVPLLILVDKLYNNSDFIANLIGQAFNETVESFRFQKARYDGYLQGTEVGMVLFYTDLLAKLWALDYMNSVPDNVIEDFKPLIGVTTSPIYEQEEKELPSTRLWFGPKDEGFQVAFNNSILFSRNVTRIYAASSNPLAPGKEVAPNASSSSFLGWWNDHYEEVAKYEQEYERLNQIMKWSLVISWLNENKKGASLDFLKAVEVTKNNWFPNWVNNHSELRYKNWRKVGFYGKGYKEAKTEAMQILYSRNYSKRGNESWVLSGGVSLASKSTFKARSSIGSNIKSISRRSNLDYGKSRDVFKTFDGIQYRFTKPTNKIISVKASPKEGAKLRGAHSEVRINDIDRTFKVTKNEFKVETNLTETEIGSFSITKPQNGGLKLAWKSSDIDIGHSLARRVSRGGKVESILISDNNVQTIIKLEGESHFLVQLENSNKWLRLAPETKPTASIELSIPQSLGQVLA